MRVYHRILLLSGLMLGINLLFQVVALYQFGRVENSLREYQANWLPSVRASGQLRTRLDALRRQELQYLMSRTEAETAALARPFRKQLEAVNHAEEMLRHLIAGPDETGVFDRYALAKTAFLAQHHRLMELMADKRYDEAQRLSRQDSLAAYQDMTGALETVQYLNQEYGDRATEAANVQSANLLRALLAALAVNLLLGAFAAVLTARRVGRPIAELARCMKVEPGELPACPTPSAPANAPKEIVALYVAFHQLTESLADSMEKLEKLAVTDQLTGLPNRRQLMDQGVKLLDLCRRGGQPCSVIMVDIDHFKRVNDTHGHAAGDAVLAQVAQVMARTVRTSDLLARFGGEEFAIVAPNAGAAQVLHLAERLRQAVQESPAVFEGKSLAVTISLGAALDAAGPADPQGGQGAPDPARDAVGPTGTTALKDAPARGEQCAQGVQAPPVLDGLSALLGQADEALYRAKANGRNRVEEYGALQ